MVYCGSLYAKARCASLTYVMVRYRIADRNDGDSTASMRSSLNSRCGEIAATVRRVWQLTPAEARSVTALAVGRSPREIAVAHHISVHTVRTQLKRAMSKAGVHTQSALVASVYSVVV